MKTLSEIRQSDSYKKFMNELKTGKMKSHEVSWRKVEEIAQQYSFMCWIDRDPGEERMMRTLANHDYIANEAN